MASSSRGFSMLFESKTRGKREENADDEDDVTTLRPKSIAIPVEVKKALEVIEAGAVLTKVRSARGQYDRFFKVDSGGIMLTYTGSKKSSCRRRGTDHSRVYMSSIREIREGLATDTFEKAFRGNNSPPDPSRCFSLVIGDENATLDLVAQDAEMQKYWVTGLTFLHKRFSERHLDKVQKIFVKEVFKKADLNGDGSLNLKEIMRLLQTFNISIDVDHATTIFKEIIDQIHSNPSHADTKTDRNTRGEDCLDVEEFAGFIDFITRRQELEYLFKTYANETNFWCEDDIVNFFKSEQFEKISPKEVKKLIAECEACPTVRDSGRISISGFYTLCGSTWMDIKQPKCRTVYQDMNQPLSHYFIDSSHNTYLAEDQLRGPSKVESYIRTLKMGCRCVELDVWNGDKCEPVVYHGHTLTSKILLKDVLNAINQYAFVSSEYPVILSIENHLSIEQQKKMARYFTTIFKNSLFLEPLPHDATCLPSPNRLKRCIIIKGKKLPDHSAISSSMSGTGAGTGLGVAEGEVSDEDEAADMDDDHVHQHVASTKSTESKHKLAKELSDCVVICQSASFKNFEQSRQKSTFKHISSFAEKKAGELAHAQSAEFVVHNTWQLSRIYPAGSRTDSSNYDPVPMWVAGCQIVALNYQTGDEPMFLNKGLFEDNGGCGYVLKPQFMRSGTGRYNPLGPYVPQWKRTLTLKIISGYQLPKKKNDKATSILDPYVKVNILGVPVDRKEAKTDIKTDNGFHPVWDKEFVFEIQCPEMALVLFRVYDYENTQKDIVVAQYCLPFERMQQGYRTVHLKSILGESMWTASLLVHVRITETSYLSIGRDTISNRTS